MKIRCLAVDDEPMALEKLKKYIEKIPFFELAATCEDAFEAMQVMAAETIDAVFIDINMPDMNGLDFISSLTERPLVVFTTAYAEYAAESYKVLAVDYLLKPFGFTDFQRAANKVLRHHSLISLERRSAETTSGYDSLFIKVNYKYLRIEQRNIRYIEGMSDYLRIFMVDEKMPIVTNTTFRQIRERLAGNFLQVHRSYIVNMDMLKEISRFRIIMDKDTWIPIGTNYKEQFVEYLDKRLVGKESKK